MASQVLGIDVGGTFTDYTIASLHDGRRFSGKVLNSMGYIEAFSSAVKEALDQAKAAPADLARIVHGTTLSTNAILEASEPQALLVTTAGFEDVLEIGRHDAPRSGNIHRWVKPRRPVARNEIVGVPERVLSDGTVARPLLDADIAAVVKIAREREVASVAVCLLHSAVNPAHEKALAEALDAAGFLVSASHEIDPAAGEYERSVATLLNAYVQPIMHRYLSEIEQRLTLLGVSAPLYVMGSDGGVLPASAMRDIPIASVLSGPAAGASAALALARRHGVRNALSLDVGGTSTDVACIFEDELELTQEGNIGDYPLSIPMIDIHTAGAGGGSIARARSGQFRVGPQSAKAVPGPAAYELGGTDATVTDALLFLGVLAESIAGGSVKLNRERAAEALAAVAGDLGQDVPSTAVAVVELASVHMSNAVRHLSIERGRDPRDFTLIACGGGGPAHAVAVAAHAGLAGVLVPSSPGVFTTEGLLSASVQRVYVRVLRRIIVLGRDPLDAGLERHDELLRLAEAFLRRDPNVSSVDTQASLELRYEGQGSTLSVPWAVDVQFQPVLEAFHAAHKQRYGYSFPERSVECVAIRVLARGELASAPAFDAQASEVPEAEFASRPVVESGGVRATPLRRRGELSADAVGPILMDEADTTIYVPPLAKVSRLHDGTLHITLTLDEEQS